MAAGADEAPPGGVLGPYIRAQRQLADLSLRQLAEMSHVSNAYLSQVERGLHQPSLKVLRAIAEALNLSRETLLTQAGLIDAATSVAEQAATGETSIDIEAAIRADPVLSAEEKEALLSVYRNFRQRHDLVETDNR
jgi:transcriptional regulator with XRE-family HTH domain